MYWMAFHQYIDLYSTLIVFISKNIHWNIENRCNFI